MQEREFNILYNKGIFYQLNEACDVIIDDFEFEVIDFEELNNAEVAITKITREF